MKHLKKYNEEIRIVKPEGSENPEAKTSSSNTPGTKIIKIEAFDVDAANILRKQMSLGLKPFYLNVENEFVEILVDKDGYPYEEKESERANRYGRPVSSTRKNSFRWKPNHYGEVYLLTDEDLESMDAIIDTSALSDEEEQLLDEAVEMHPELEAIIPKLVATEFTDDGEVEGPGTGTSDSIPALLSDGEFVFTAKAVKNIGVDKLRKMMKQAEESYDAGNQSQEEEEIV